MTDIDAQTKVRLRSISDTLSGARQVAQALPGFPGDLPETFAQAYEVQRLSRAAWPDRVAGWKVGGVPPAFISSSGTDRLVGPIFSNRVKRASDNCSTAMPVFRDGFAAIEPEFIIEIGESPDQDRLYIGAEIASSPLPAINDIGPIAVICDFGNNNGLLLGDEIPGWQDIEPTATVVEAVIDGQIVGSRVLDDFRKDAVEAYLFMLDHAQRHDIALPRGTFVSTGAITGVHEAPIGARSRLDFGDFGSIELHLTQAEPLES